MGEISMEDFVLGPDLRSQDFADIVTDSDCVMQMDFQMFTILVIHSTMLLLVCDNVFMKKCVFLLLFQLYSSDDLDNEVDEILQDFEHKVNRPILHTAIFYWHGGPVSRDSE